LKANVVLEELRLSCVGGAACPLGMLEDLLSKHNYTLRTVRLGRPFTKQQQRRINAILRRNDRVREANAQLEALQYRVEQMSIWPQAMERIGSHSALLHRFVRQGNVGALADRVRPELIPLNRKKRQEYNLSPRGTSGKRPKVGATD
jgi:hypothetical protein